MILYINTIEDGMIEIKILNNEIIIAQKKVLAKYAEAEKLLPLIDKILQVKKLRLDSLKKIKVENKGGSFTSLRIGVITANALGYALGIPVEGEKSKELGGQGFSIVEPVYSGEPNITIKKKKI